VILLLAWTTDAASTVPLNASGALLLGPSVALVVGLNIFCFYRVLRESQPTEHHRAPLEIDTGDHET